MDIQQKKAVAIYRSGFYRLIRAFFHDRYFIETETPILSSTLIPESCIEVFKTERFFYDETKADLFLTPSPEIYMKSLISQGIGDCFQLTKSFRNLEAQSQKHSNEFTMLEWYAMNHNYFDNIEVTKDLLTYMLPMVHEEAQHLFKNFKQVSMNELFLEYVSIDLQQSQTLAAFKLAATRSGYEEYVARSETWEDLFNFIFVSHIENHLPKDVALFVTDYPAQLATTARKQGDHYERWELYMNGWEIANCYTEEAGYDEMLQLFHQEGQLKAQMKVPHPTDYAYLEIFKQGQFPECSGVALGVDRLIAIAMHVETLEETLLF